MTTANPRTGRVVAAGTIGNILEWFDFSIYGYFALSIGKTFFAGADPVSQVLATFGVFAVGFVMRPLGGLLTGHIGDRYGRRTALTFSVTAMAVPTCLMGLLPGYEMLGVWAPILLTLLRMFQGLSVGGEYTTAMVFLVERAPPGRRGLMGAIANSSASVGVLMGSATAALIDFALPTEAAASWGWRIPFVLGLFVGLAGLWLRRGLEETAPEKSTHAPVAEMVREHLPTLATFAGLAVFNAVPFYIVFLYVVTWLQNVDGMAPAQALAINSASIALGIPISLAAGWLSDRFGRRLVCGAALAAGLILAVPLLRLLHGPDLGMIVLGQLGFVLIICTYAGAQPAMLVEAAPARVRCSIVALGYNVTLGLLGGMTPLAAQWLIDRTGIDYIPAHMIIIASVISLIALSYLRETYRERLQTA